VRQQQTRTATVEDEPLSLRNATRTHSLYIKKKTTYVPMRLQPPTLNKQSGSPALVSRCFSRYIMDYTYHCISYIYCTYLKYPWSHATTLSLGEQHAAWLQSGDIASDLQQSAGEGRRVERGT
jgi:hypothetical protein